MQLENSRPPLPPALADAPRHVSVRTSEPPGILTRTSRSLVLQVHPPTDDQPAFADSFVATFRAGRGDEPFSKDATSKDYRWLDPYDPATTQAIRDVLDAVDALVQRAPADSADEARSSEYRWGPVHADLTAWYNTHVTIDGQDYVWNERRDDPALGDLQQALHRFETVAASLPQPVADGGSAGA